MKKLFITKIIVPVAAILALIITVSVVSAYNTGNETEKKIINMGGSLYPYLTFETITERSVNIVHGKVADISKTVVYYTNNGYEECYKNLTIDIINGIKGTDSKNKINYKQLGGESDTQIQVYPEFPPLSIGDEVVLFLYDFEICMGPQGIVNVENGNAMVKGKLFPDTYDKSVETIPVDEYVEAVKRQVDINAEKPASGK